MLHGNKMYFLVLFILLLNCHWLCADKCTEHLHNLADKQQHFVFCSTTNAVPVKLCVNCAPHYGLMQESFNDLLKFENCSERYINKDRINIVVTTENMLVGLWEKAFCNDCVNSTSFQDFDNKLKTLQSCFNDHQKAVCDICAEAYQELNTFYTDLDQTKNGKICFDMQDSMNRTRSEWSKTFKCCRRNFEMTLFIIASACMTSLPIIFYGGAYVLTKRQERNHGIINTDPDFETAEDSSSTTAIIPPNIAPVQNELPREKPKKIISVTDSDDSDYEQDVDLKKP